MNHNHLYRSQKDRKIAGVAGGIAEYLQIDSTVVRLIWVLAVLLGGAGVLAYIIAWIVVPEENETAQPEIITEPDAPSIEQKSKSTGRIHYLGIFLLCLGAFFLLKEFLPINLTKYIWPVVLIGAGLALLIPRK